MKKLVSLLLCVMLLLPVAALAEDGWFAAAQFSDEEWLLIQLLGMDEDYGPYEFKAASHDGYDVDWPIGYDDVKPYYDKVDQLLGCSGTMEGLDQVPDGA